VRIGELARAAEVSTRSLRYYEEQGLLDAYRTSGGHREYEDSDVVRVRTIQMLFTAGLPSRKIVDLLPFLDTGVATAEMTEHLQDEHERLNAQIAELEQARDRLAQIRQIAQDSTNGRPPAECVLAAGRVATLSR